jgi:hypothetical protein
MDIENFNYFEILLREYKQGKYLRGHIPVFPNINRGHVFLPMDLSPPGMTFKRDNQRFINNFYVELITKAFTNYENDVKEKKYLFNHESSLAQVTELQTLNKIWKEELLEKDSDFVNRVESKLLVLTSPGELNLKRKYKI